MDISEIKTHHHDHDDDDHGTGKIVEFLDKFFEAYKQLKEQVSILEKEVERISENQEKILDFFDEVVVERNHAKNSKSTSS